MRRHRPSFIPIEARCRAALRQIGRSPEAIDYLIQDAKKNVKGQLKTLLRETLRKLAGVLGGSPDDFECDHDPALSLRFYDLVTKKYFPDANNPDFLTFRLSAPEAEGSHYIKTYVRGEHGARSDTAERVHRRRLEQNKLRRAGKVPPKRKIPQRKAPWGKKRKWR